MANTIPNAIMKWITGEWITDRFTNTICETDPKQIPLIVFPKDIFSIFSYSLILSNPLGSWLEKLMHVQNGQLENQDFSNSTQRITNRELKKCPTSREYLAVANWLTACC